MSEEKLSQQDLAISFINETKEHIFITGKAGTGKTTLLDKIKLQSNKKLVIAAPTGVAAINAGGVTLHSLFKLPSELIVPVTDQQLPCKTIGSFLKGHTFSPEKESLLLSLEVLIIDEVSMVRADTLDAIDHLLRQVRGNPVPFGGIQVVYVGDLFQLPPIASSEEETELMKYYPSVFFFDAHAFATTKPIYFELTEVYRQKEPAFLKLLNNLRSNTPDKDDEQILTSKYLKNISDERRSGYVRLTSHRGLADGINLKALEQLPGKTFVYGASSNGIVETKNLPVDEELHLKLDAQVMFVKNDLSGRKRYFNGKIGKITSLSSTQIIVSCEDGQAIAVEKEKWQFMQYSQQGNNQLTQVITGEFQQYPLRLAWAMTIHKCQGLTFDKAIIDAGAAFAPGQVYVALSRVRTLDGIILSTPINFDSLQCNKNVVAFTNKMESSRPSEKSLEVSRREAVFLAILDAFTLYKITHPIEKLPASVDKYRFSVNSHYLNLTNELTKELKALNAISEKFYHHIRQYWEGNHNAQTKGAIRIEEAATYFSKELADKIIKPLQNTLEVMRIKKAPKDLISYYEQIEKTCTHQIDLMRQCCGIWNKLIEGEDPVTLLKAFENIYHSKSSIDTQEPTSKSDLSPTQKTTLRLYKAGLDIGEIARQRNLGAQTIESHITLFIEKGYIPLQGLVHPDHITLIEEALTNGMSDIHELKARLDDKVSYFDIRAILARQSFLSKAQSSASPNVLF